MKESWSTYWVSPCRKVRIRECGLLHALYYQNKRVFTGSLAAVTNYMWSEFLD